MALYFCCMAAFAWWACLALAWFLAAGLKWGHEAIENKSHLFHLVAWAIPALQTISVLVLGKVEGTFKFLWNSSFIMFTESKFNKFSVIRYFRWCFIGCLFCWPTGFVFVGCIFVAAAVHLFSDWCYIFDGRLHFTISHTHRNERWWKTHR